MPEYNDTLEYAVGTTGTTLNSSNGLRRRWSEQVAATLRAIGLLDTMIDGTTAPVDQTALWLDTTTDPAVLKYYEPLVTDWIQITQDWLRSADFSAHITNTSNPHSVTAAQLGVPATSENATISGNRTYTAALDFSAVNNKSTIRSDLGLAIGTDVQEYDAVLASLSGLSLSSGDLLYATGADTLASLAASNGQFVSFSGGVPVAVDSPGLIAHPDNPRSMNTLTTALFTGIPSGVNMIVVAFTNLSTSGSDHGGVRLGDSGGIESTGYEGNFFTSSGIFAAPGDRFYIDLGGNNRDAQGSWILFHMGGNQWVGTSTQNNNNGSMMSVSMDKTLSGELTQLEIILAGSDNFDLGEISVLYM